MNFTTHTHSLTHSLTHSPRTRLRRLVLSAPKSDAPAPRSSDSISRCHTTVPASFARELRNRCQLRSLQYLYPGAPAIARGLGRASPRHKRSMLTFSLKNKTSRRPRSRYHGTFCATGSLFSSKDNEENVNARWLTWAASFARAENARWLTHDYLQSSLLLKRWLTDTCPAQVSASEARLR